MEKPVTPPWQRALAAELLDAYVKLANERGELLARDLLGAFLLDITHGGAEPVAVHTKLLGVACAAYDAGERAREQLLSNAADALHALLSCDAPTAAKLARTADLADDGGAGRFLRTISERLDGGEEPLAGALALLDVAIERSKAPSATSIPSARSGSASSAGRRPGRSRRRRCTPRGRCPSARPAPPVDPRYPSRGAPRAPSQSRGPLNLLHPSNSRFVP